MTIERCVLVVMALGALASRVGWAAPPVATASSTGTAPGTGTGAVATPGAAQNQHAMATPHFTPNSPKANNVPGVSGSAAGRSATVRGVVGGPAKYDAKKGAIIGGTVTKGKL